MQEVYVDMPDGSSWKVPLLLLALYKLSQNDELYACGGTRPEHVYVAMTRCLDDATGLLDWAVKHLMWADIAAYAISVGDPASRDQTYEIGWREGPKDIVE